MDDIVTITASRRILKELALTLSNLERDEAARALSHLASQIDKLIEGDFENELWHQVCKSLDGPTLYGLQRINFVPASLKEKEEQ